jgi:hypothetical protein
LLMIKGGTSSRGAKQQQKNEIGREKAKMN